MLAMPPAPRYPAERVAEAVLAMSDKHSKKRESALVCAWFHAVPVDERAEYRDLVEDHLMSLSKDGMAEREIKMLASILRDSKMPGFDKKPPAPAAMDSETDARVRAVLERLGLSMDQ